MKFKLKIPKFKIGAFWIKPLIILVCLLEIYILYAALYARVDLPAEKPLARRDMKIVDLSLPDYHKIKAWIESRKNYIVPPYSLEISPAEGRENPFRDPFLSIPTPPPAP